MNESRDRSSSRVCLGVSLVALCTLCGCLADGLDEDTVRQAGGGPGGGSSEPPPACEATTTPNHPICYVRLTAGEPLVFDLAAGRTKYFWIPQTTNGTLVGVQAVDRNENPYLHATTANETPGPANGVCHSLNPQGQDEGCYILNPRDGSNIKIAVHATTALTGVEILALLAL